ncbi:hypothetical protein I7I50_04980 [Histoplasma capsulatum G186AR]|uniref:Uncharacterized protein n=1 Tax=Ajellomyces capsulatus TaxID=5037 RepID=A0A8H7Z610_AJECA|nr:hypothetical protein I7I52_03238 [Histoplasma capsulatum]QSS75738.1 hypothetical protein I7I50_04980 [Histoplasma capsulatum G186AR]
MIIITLGLKHSPLPILSWRMALQSLVSARLSFSLALPYAQLVFLCLFLLPDILSNPRYFECFLPFCLYH